jgi:hypothetical protein
MNRIERAKSGISANDLRALLRLYDVTDQERVDELLTLARGARQDPWWRSYRDVATEDLLKLMDYESASSVISQFETVLVPGILQTEAYASAVLQRFSNKKSDEEVERLVELRTKRKQLLSVEKAPNFRFILDESVIRREVGSVSLRRDQFQELVSVAKNSNVQIQIVRFAAGLYPGMMGAFEVVQFEDAPDEKVVFAEGSRDFFDDDSSEAGKYLETFGQITRAALDPKESLKLLEAAASSSD